MVRPEGLRTSLVLGAASLLAGLAWNSVAAWRGAVSALPIHADPMLIGAMVMLSIPEAISVMVWPVVFCAWAVQLFWSDGRIPLRSVVALVLLTLLTIAYFAVSAEYAWNNRGPSYVIRVAADNAVALTLLWVLLSRTRRTPSFVGSLAFHWSVVAWLVSVGFPDIVQLP